MGKLRREIKYIVVTGVECSGKSTLCKDLAIHFNEPYAREMVRSYMEGKETYSYDDIEAIARLQWAEISKQAKEAKQFLFIDTAFFVLKIWSEEKYGKCCRFILDKLASFKPDLYLLPAIDIPYVNDRLREAPREEDRKRLFEIYKAHLVGECFVIVAGDSYERIGQSVDCVLGIVK